jgi:hypothetical protein
MRTIPKSIKHPDWSVTGIPKGESRLNRNKIELLDAKGQEAMRKVCRLSREVLDIVAAAIKPGVNTDYLDEVCHKACIERKVCSDIFAAELSLTICSHILLRSTTEASPSHSVLRQTRWSATVSLISASSSTAIF